MTDYRGGGLTNMKIRQVEKDLEKMRSEIEEKKKEIENKNAAHGPTYATFSKKMDDVEEDLRSNTVYTRCHQ